MKKRIFGMLLMGAMVVASMSMFTSCKDYDDDINKLQSQIDAITAQNLQSQLTTLQSALAAAQSAAQAAQQTADKAVSDAAAASKAATEAASGAAAGQSAAAKAQETADAAAAAAKAAQEAVEALAAAAATKQDVEDLTKAINDLKALIETVSANAATKEELSAAVAALEAKIAAIDGKLITLDDVDKLLEQKGIATDAVVQDLVSQVEALKKFQESIEKADFGSQIEALQKIQTELGTKIEALEKFQKSYESWKSGVDTAIASLTQIQKDIKANATEVSEAKKLAQQANNAVSGVTDNVNVLNVFVKRNLSSLVLRPDTYYGGIEGVSVYIFQLPEEKNNPEKPKDLYHYFDRVGELNLSDYGTAQYHVNPTNVDLSNYTIDFYNWHSDIKEPAATERTTPTRSGDAGGIAPVYTTTEALLKADANNLKNGILTVPFTADAATIEANLKKGIGTIASLSMTKKGNKAGVADTTVNSDYAIVVPEYGYGLLIGDNTFPVEDRYFDIIGYDGGLVNSAILHRSFSFLALATTSPTHTIKYDGSFNITKVLEARYCLDKAYYLSEVTDTAVYVTHGDHKAIAKWNGTTLNKAQDGDASINKNMVKNMSAATFKKLGFKYVIEPVDYTLGSNVTGETVHLELITNSNGEVIAYPRNVTAKGETIKGKTANAACVGRQPVVCIMIKDSKDRIVSFAYMKFLITQDAVVPEAKEADFDIKDIWVNCKDDAGRVTWSEIEYHIYDQLLGGMSKEDFDKNYVFDYYAQTSQKVEVNNATWSKVTRNGVQYDAKFGKRIDESKAFGSIDEEWNESAQGEEDATTHIIKWAFTAAQLKDKAEALKAAGGLEDAGDYYVNKAPITTWVRYAHRPYTTADIPAIGKASDKGNPAIWVKLTIPAGEFHVAKGDMGANKILTYWYDLNSKTNATGTDDAYEVRINVPVPVPEASATVKTIGYSIDNNTDKLDIRYDNLLEGWENDLIATTTPAPKRTNVSHSEFTKNLKDFFIGGKLSATVKDPKHFSSITGMKLGCEFILPSTTIGNATFNAGTNNGIANSWVVNGYTGAKYTLILNADRTKIQIKAKNSTVYPIPVDFITLNYDDNAKVADRQITVVNYINGEDQDDILNYKTHNELGELETFTAYINIKAIDACAPVYWNNMWFNARFLRPLDLEDPKQALAPDAPNDWHEIDLTDALIVKDWREYYGDRLNRTGGADVKVNITGVGNVKAFDFAYYQVLLDINAAAFYTDANLGTSVRSDNYTLGSMPRINSVADATSKNFIKTADVPNLKLEKISNTKLRYLNNSGVTGGFHVFVPITMTYIYGYMTVRQTKWVTIGITASVEQAMIEGE
jgi:hypothetical protein